MLIIELEWIYFNRNATNEHCVTEWPFKTGGFDNDGVFRLFYVIVVAQEIEILRRCDHTQEPFSPNFVL